MKIFTRDDLFNKVGITRGRSLFISLRRYNLGFDEMKLQDSGNRYGSAAALRSTVHFSKNECVRLFIYKIRNSKKNPFRNPNPSIIRAWEKSIRELRSL